MNPNDVLRGGRSETEMMFKEADRLVDKFLESPSVRQAKLKIDPERAKSIRLALR